MVPNAFHLIVPCMHLLSPNEFHLIVAYTHLILSTELFFSREENKKLSFLFKRIFESY